MNSEVQRGEGVTSKFCGSVFGNLLFKCVVAKGPLGTYDD